MNNSMSTASGLISQYETVDLYILREAGMRSHPVERKLSTHSLEYYVEYVTLTDDGTEECKRHSGNQHSWNCGIDGFPSRGNLNRWAIAHAKRANEAGGALLVVMAILRRCSNGEPVATWSHAHGHQ